MSTNTPPDPNKLEQLRCYILRRINKQARLGEHTYRECLREWEKNGWRIDFRALQAQKGDIAFAIPCPGRRESGNWVLDAVPLVG